MSVAADRRVTTYRLLSGAFAVLAVAGWGLYAYSSSATDAREQALQAQVSQLQGERDQANAARDAVVAERDRLRSAAGELDTVRQQIAAAQQELKTIAQARAQAGEDPVATGSTAMQPAKVEAAQEVLARLGFGKLNADGMLGPNTRRAIESFEKAKGLPVTGQLNARTVQALETASGTTIR